MPGRRSGKLAAAVASERSHLEGLILKSSARCLARRAQSFEVRAPQDEVD
jgi:hypothetical protein